MNIETFEKLPVGLCLINWIGGINPSPAVITQDRNGRRVVVPSNWTATTTMGFSASVMPYYIEQIESVAIIDLSRVENQNANCKVAA
ncbi:hypothetical protein [Vibrio phage vB_VmeM-Yong XC32]|nr:hypothetical protein [Vibrio phage vB_VmeM-Yong XC31]QAX96501.1 hypothetical protein [Vibrio phage vB_VmeM-Yong XC32]QAX96818.1 hypothetical protein [Vibrio phage vB_VmeM-Yong MS31]QAX97137.1 hypothetical protein [Vibrio phage vB_VmeM-Yong MS32]